MFKPSPLLGAKLGSMGIGNGVVDGFAPFSTEV